MGRTLITLLIGFLGLSGFGQSAYAPAIAKVRNSLVFVQSDKGSCTGFVVDVAKKHVQTDAHCDGPDIYANRVKALVKSKDTHKDLMILYVPELDPSLTALKPALKDPEIGDEVIAAGHAYALEKPFFRRSMVSDVKVIIPDVAGGPFIAVDSGFIGGQSGGPVVNLNGEVVSIVQKANAQLGIGVGIEVIKDRVGRFWSKE